MITLTGTFQYDDGIPLDGWARVALIDENGRFFEGGAAQERGTQIPVPHYYDVTITNGSVAKVDGFIPDTFLTVDTIWGNNEISPPGTRYRYKLFDAIDRQLGSDLDLTISSTPFNLFLSQPTAIPAPQLQPTLLTSKPPTGGMTVSNFYVDSSGKLVVEYNDIPV